MKNLRQLCAALTLAAVLSASAFAGEISCGAVPPPPPPPAASEAVTTQGEISCGVTADVMAVLLSLLSVF